MLEAIDGHNFWTGSPPALNDRQSGFYQADINGLISAILVILRLLASCNAGLLTWRLIYILLEKSGLSLSELCRMANWKLPVMPRQISRNQFAWSCYAFVVILLLWPPSVAAPLANSSLTWIPSARESPGPNQPYNISIFSSNSSAWAGFLYPHVITPGIFKASLMVSQDPGYAFVALNESRVPLKRYVYGSSLNFEYGGVGNMSLPYFKITDIKWIDAPSGIKISDLNNASMLSPSPTPLFLADAGMLGFFSEEKWDYHKAIATYEASSLETFEGKRNVSIYVGERNVAKPLEDGNEPTIETPCSTSGDILGELPSVIQYGEDVYVGEDWKAKRCYMLAEVTIKAGLYSNRRVNITRVGSSSKLHMAVPIHADEPNTVLHADYRTTPVLDMLSEVTRLMTYMDLTPQWQKNNSIDNYVAGMLTTAYHATWSAMPMSDDIESVTLIALEPVIRAQVSRTRLYTWLLMNSTLAVAAMMTAGAASLCGKVKMVRDTTLAAMTIDLQRIAHKEDSGLCNAVTLSNCDSRKGRLRWRGDPSFELMSMSKDSYGHSCIKEVE
jgi:hypothetical protein